MTAIFRVGRGTPLVLLHCLGVDHRLWEIAAAGLSEKFELVSYDFPGHGASPVPATGYTIEDLSEQLAALLKSERLGRVHLAGISLGGLVAQCFAANHPDKIDKLVLIDTTPRYTDEMRDAWHERAQVARTHGVAAMTDRLLDIWFTAHFIAADGPAVRYVRDCFAHCAGEGYALACEALAAADLRPLLKSIAAPTLVVCGRQDVPSFIDAAVQFNGEIKTADLVWLEQARHASILEQPDAFRAALMRFLVD
jgi:3-oxoadipate enol-lactonase